MILTVHSVFKRVVNLRAPDDRRISLVINSWDEGPGTILMSILPSLKQGDILEDRDLSLETKMCGGFPVTRCERDINPGLIRRLRDIAGFFIKRRSSSFPRCCLSTDLGSLTIGMGDGLTPSVDDYACGLITAMLFFGRVQEKSSIIGIVESWKNRTHWLSHSFIRDSAHGLAHRRIHSFLESISSGEDEMAVSSAWRIFRHGASSGAWWIMGFVSQSNLND